MYYTIFIPLNTVHDQVIHTIPPNSLHDQITRFIPSSALHFADEKTTNIIVQDHLYHPIYLLNIVQDHLYHPIYVNIVQDQVYHPI